MEKITNVVAIGYVVENFGKDIPADILAKLEKIKESYAKKSASKKPTATQEANEALKEVVLSVLTTEGATVSEILKKDEAFADISNQKMSALLKQLVDAGKVVKTIDKKKALFSLVA